MNVYTHKLTVYLAADGWRWRLVAKNGKTVADSGEAYKRKRSAVAAAEALASAVIVLHVDETPPTKRRRAAAGKFKGSKKAAP